MTEFEPDNPRAVSGVLNAFASSAGVSSARINVGDHTPEEAVELIDLMVTSAAELGISLKIVEVDPLLFQFLTPPTFRPFFDGYKHHTGWSIILPNSSLQHLVVARRFDPTPTDGPDG